MYYSRFIRCVSFFALAALLAGGWGCKGDTVNTITSVTQETPRFWTPVNGPLDDYGVIRQVQRIVRAQDVVYAYGSQFQTPTGAAMLQRSDDGGITWRAVGGAGYPGGTELAGTPFGALFGLWTRGVIRSSDGGVTWDTVNAGLPTVIDSATGNSVLNATLWSAAGDSNGTVYAAAMVGIGTPRYTVYRSTDFGAHWEESAHGLGGSLVVSLAVSPTGVVFASTYYGMFRSADRGQTWVAGTGLPLYGGYTPVFTSIAFPPGGSVVAGGTQGTYRSSIDGAFAWESANTGLPRVNSYTYIAGPSTGSIYACCAGGLVYHSTNAGLVWSPLYDVTHGENPTVFTAAAGDHLLGANYGVYRSLDPMK